MTLINSCWPKSFSHLIFLLSTFTLTATTIPTTHLATSMQKTAGDVATTVIGYDRKNDNKRYDNLFDFKTDINNLLFHSHGNLQPSTISRKRRDTIVPPSESATASTPMTANLISNVETKVLSLNLSFGNLTTFSTNIGDSFALLNVSHNFLSSFNASKLTKLKVLDLSHNNLSEFNLVGHKLLQTIDVSTNSLTKFKCVNCESLQSLNLSVNRLKSIALENSNNLKLIDLSANELSDIDLRLFHNKSNLSDVILACNRIRIVRKDLFQQLRSLRRLDLSHNDISDIESGTFAGMATLEIFDLSFNRIHIASLQALQSIDDLARLSLAGNVLLRNALRGFAVTWSIMELDYSRVGLCQVPDSLAQSVRILNLYGNFLNIICSGDFESYPLLHKLVLSNNNLTSIENDALGRLEMLTILYLDNNLLTQIPASLPSSLIKFHMHNNRISDIKPSDLINLINLELLDVSDNRIIYMPQLALPTLITLSVKSCGLENVHRQIFKSCPNLRHLLIDENPIKCSELMEIESCNDNSLSLTNEYANDDIDFNGDDAEREERYLNSISYFPSAQSCRKTPEIQNETTPNCWNEQKLITSFILTNDSTTTASLSASNDNKFLRQSTHENEGNSSRATMKINNNEMTKVQGKIVTLKPQQNEKMKNSKDEMKPMKKAKLPVNVVKIEIKALNDNNNSSINTDGFDAHRQKGLNNSVLMKTKQFKSTEADGTEALITNSEGNNSHTKASNENQTTAAINRNLIDYVNGDYRKAQSSDKLISANKTKAIKDNERFSSSSNSTNNSKSIDKAHSLNDNKSRNSHNNSVNGLPLVHESMPQGNNSGNESIDATDHQQHTAINHEVSEKWKDIRSETINHPGLLIVITVSVGVLFTSIVVYVYRCNFINSARRRRRRGSCESINEGRDVLNDNFNEETHSFTIETHSPLTAQPTAVNHCDLLPMDILNSTLNHSIVDSNAAHISMHLW